MFSEINMQGYNPSLDFSVRVVCLINQFLTEVVLCLFVTVGIPLNLFN